VIAKNQHIVTKAYLARWASDELVHVFDLYTGKARQENIRNVCAQRYFYSPPDGAQQFERALSRLESFWMEAQEGLIRAARTPSRLGRWTPKILYKAQKEQLADALVQQLVRTERVRTSFSHLGEDGARTAHLSFMIRPDVAGLARQIQDGVWLIGVRAAESFQLYTSDHPVCVVPMESEPTGGAYRLKGFMYPLSPDHLLVIYARGTTNFTKEYDGRLLPLDRSLTLQNNALQAGTAERVIVSATAEFDVARRWYEDHRLQDA
jgi:hypothetical protein